jgi:hypothetical protein
MGFLDTLKSLLSSDPSSKDGSSKSNSGDYALSSELRLHARYFVLTSDLASLEITATGAKGNIKDLSYGGILAEFKDSWLNHPGISDKNSIEAKLTFLDQSTPVFVQVVHEKNGGQLVGLSFIHKNIETLVFLREVLENLRIGSTFYPLNTSHTKATESGTTVYRGDGPCDLQIMEKDGKIQKALLTFRGGSTYFEMKLEGDVVTTARSKNEDQKVAAQMEPSPKGVDPSILRSAIQLLLGFLATNPKSKVVELLPKLYQQLYSKRT